MRKLWIWVVIIGVAAAACVSPKDWQHWLYPCLAALLFVSLSLLKWPECIWDWGILALSSTFLVIAGFTGTDTPFPWSFFALACVLAILGDRWRRRQKSASARAQDRGVTAP